MKRCLADDGYWKRKPCNDECIYYDTCRYKGNKERKAELKAQEDELKNSNRHDLGELQIMQGYSLERKIQLTCERIKAWYEWWDGQVYVSFSGGKDSTVLLDLVRNVCGYDDVPAVFVDTGLEYPEIRDFVKTYDNVEWLKPKKNFKQVISDFGYPFISKEVSNCVQGARKYLTEWNARQNALASKQASKKASKQAIPNACYMADLIGIDRRKNKDNPDYLNLQMGIIPNVGGNYRFDRLNGVLKDSKGNKSQFNQERYKFFLDAPFEISDKCCNIMKKAPCKKYEHDTGRKPLLATMATESIMRTQKWLHEGCNAFYSDRPKGKPLSFWTEQDILLYIKTHNIPICSVYGDIVEDLSGTDEVEGQLTWSDIQGFENMERFDADRLPLKTTGCNRTGCMFCGYGCHLEKEGEGRFERMKETHPKQYEYIMKSMSEGGLGYKEVIDWINENNGGNIHIRY